MFVLPLLPDWLFDKPHMSSTDHTGTGTSVATAAPPRPTTTPAQLRPSEASPPLHGELRRLAPLPELNVAQGDSRGGVLTEGYS
jgi:hypothetical protein